jgi:hypothetical protein
MSIQTAQRQLCLDLMKVSWVATQESRQSDCAILLEIEPDGGLLQTTVAIPYGSEITLNPGPESVQGRVTDCQQDDYGYIVSFQVIRGGARWFPNYVPPFVHSTSNG